VSKPTITQVRVWASRPLPYDPGGRVSLPTTTAASTADDSATTTAAPATTSTSTDLLGVVGVQVETANGAVGVGLAPCVPAAMPALVALVEQIVAPLVVGHNPLDHERLYARAHHRLAEQVGWPGLAARAYAAVDLALWDLKGRLSGLPCLAAQLLPATATPAELLRRVEPLLRQGVMGLLVRLGGCDVEADANLVQALREGLGDAWLGVDAAGRYDLPSLLSLIELFVDELQIDWLAEPLHLADLAGLARLGQSLTVPIAAGEPLDELAAIETLLARGAVQVLRLNLWRIGGYTPALRVVHLAERFGVKVVPVGPPELTVPLACGLGEISAVEYCDWLQPVLTQPVRLQRGQLAPPDAAGLGVELAEPLR
jgi:L-alanine-DL-glutamate epimerase-like enolase superfamily enzyme